MNRYYSGQMVTFSASFAVNGTPTDPGTAYFSIWHTALGTLTYAYPASAEVIRQDTGQFTFNYTLTRAGQWRYYWRSTGDVHAASGHVLECLGLLP